MTSLSWLQNLTVHDLISPATVMTALSPPKSCYLQSSPPCRSTRNIGVSLSPIKKCLLQSANFRRHPKKYRSNCDKPPFSYSTLIYLAIQQSKSGMATLNEIYRWIKDNFKFYRCSEPGWQVSVIVVLTLSNTNSLVLRYNIFTEYCLLQNSIRHNLSLNELFSKIPRAHGKGNHWGINPDYIDLLQDRKDNALLEHDRHHSGKLRSSKLKASYGRKRAHSQGELASLHSKDSKRIQRKRRESEHKTSPSDVCGIPGDLDWISLLGSQRNSHQRDKATFTPPDLVVAGELCSPLTLPTAITAAVPVELPATPHATLSHGALLEEVVLKQDSPSPQVVLPWAEGGSQSPHCSAQTHPWAESRESTMHEVHNLFKMAKPATSSVWSPEHSWSSSTSSACSSSTYLTRTPLLRGSSVY